MQLVTLTFPKRATYTCMLVVHAMGVNTTGFVVFSRAC